MALDGHSSSPESLEITRILREHRDSPEKYNDKLFPLLYDVLKKNARRQLYAESSARTLRPTELVNELYIKMVVDRTEWKDRAHFLGCAANAMRQILVDYARKRTAQKRGSGLRPAPIVDRAIDQPVSLEDILAIDEALSRLRTLDPTKAEVLKLRFFGGLKLEEVATVLDIGLTSAKEHQRAALAWVNRELTGRRAE
jgi:RNA polymerase sigma factor (TIGR02999 family)